MYISYKKHFPIKFYIFLSKDNIISNNNIIICEINRKCEFENDRSIFIKCLRHKGPPHIFADIENGENQSLFILENLDQNPNDKDLYL